MPESVETLESPLLLVMDDTICDVTEDCPAKVGAVVGVAACE